MFVDISEIYCYDKHNSEKYVVNSDSFIHNIGSGIMNIGMRETTSCTVSVPIKKAKRRISLRKMHLI